MLRPLKLAFLAICVEESWSHQGRTAAIGFRDPQRALYVRGGSSSKVVVKPSSSNTALRKFALTQPTSTLQGNSYTYIDNRPVFLRLAGVILVEIMLNILRPAGDPDWFLEDRWVMRLPRFLWDSSMCCTALLASMNNQPPFVFLMLAIMLGSTAVVDLCIWSPVFAMATEWETCSCARQEPRCWLFCKCIERVCAHNFRKGTVRLLVSLQSFVFGMCCLSTSGKALGAFTHLRDVAKAERMAKQMALAIGHIR